LLTPSTSLSSEFLLQMSVDFDAPQNLVGAPLGTRRILYPKSGRFAGPTLDGVVLPGGGDWVLLRTDGIAELDIRMTLRTSGGELISMYSRGIFDMSAELAERIRNGVEVDPAEYYFRTSPIFETGSEKYSRLNRLIYVGIGRRTARGMITDIFLIK
jgi:hypothetical protein